MASMERGLELETLYQELRRGLVRPLYLFYGDEDFLLGKATQVLQSAVLQGIPVDFNFDQFYARESDPQRIIECAMTLPMMAPRRLVVLRDVDFFKEAALERLLKYISKPSPTTVLMMTGTTINGRSRVITQTRKEGLVLEFRTLYEKQVRQWLRSELVEIRKRIPEEGIDLILERVGENLRELHSELTKISLYVGERREITMDDLRAVVVDVNLDSIFEFTNAVGNGEAGQALLQLTRSLEQDGEGASNKLIAMLHRHFQQLYLARVSLDGGMGAKEAALQAGVRENLLWKWEKETLPQVKARSAHELERALQQIFKVSLQMRSSRVSSGALMEGLVLSLSAGGRRGHSVR